MRIGSLGDVVFQVDANTVATFDKLVWSAGASYATHDVHMRKATLELTGHDPDEISFNMKLSAFLGVDPQVMLERISRMLLNGKASTLVIGTKVYGSRWVVSKIKKTLENFTNKGALLSAEVNVTLMEYTEV